MRFSKWKIVVPRGKIIDYLLSMTHPVGRSKATFFRSLGFDEDSIDLLEKGLMKIGRSVEPRESITSSDYGTKHIIDGILDTPHGKQVIIRTVWIEMEEKVLQLVTAYPAKRES